MQEDKSLWVWGYMGLDPYTKESVNYDTPTCIMKDVKYASGNFAIKTDGTLWALYKDHENMMDKPNESMFYGIEPYMIMEGVKYAYGFKRAMVIKEDGSLWVWGDNRDGALGTGTGDYIKEPIKIMDDVVYGSLGEFNCYALKSNGELWEMGIAYDFYASYSGTENSYTQEEFYKSCMPHKILDGVLVCRD